jgi:hypothetical protein
MQRRRRWSACASSRSSCRTDYGRLYSDTIGTPSARST